MLLELLLSILFLLKKGGLHCMEGYQKKDWDETTIALVDSREMQSLVPCCMI
jgi:hypothetical protein